LGGEGWERFPVAVEGTRDAGTGISLASRTRRRKLVRTQRQLSVTTAPAVRMLVTTPSVEATAPPARVARGMLPLTTVRTVAFVRPRSPGGVMACRRLVSLTM
jgi:hypothetical protein